MAICFMAAGAAWGVGSSPDHWAFRPVVAPDPPVVEDAGWGRAPLDAFVFEKLQAVGLSPAPEASRHELIRRATFDLHGLPPTFEEIEAFVADPDPEAYEKLIDRLLAAPEYGERWGRHWLDVARYADTKGYLAGGVERRFAFSFTYRDWVIDALNEDVPYDDFVRYQLAADAYVDRAEADRKHLAALGFLTLGRRFLNREPDIIDDRIDVTTRGLLGLTVSCARCHDHKTDPIPTEDYYSLYGVFASSTEPDELPLIGDPEATPGYAEFQRGVDERLAAIAAFLEERRREQLGRERIATYLSAVAESWDGDDDSARQTADRHSLYRRIFESWRSMLRDPDEPVEALFAPWLEWRSLDEEGFRVAVDAGLSEPGNPVTAAVLEGRPASFGDLNSAYGALVAAAFAGDPPGGGAPASAGGFDPAVLATVREVLSSPGRPGSFSADEMRRAMHRGDRDRLTERERELDGYRATAEGAPPRAMAMVDKPAAVEPRVFLRGNPSSPGPAVPRQFLAVLSPGGREPFREGSGRRELAEAIVDPANPLTPRVIVNRLWLLHFGAPLAETPSDFGVQCAEPFHLALLDHLATSLIADGWSLKSLHRRIMLSSTYRQSSQASPEALERDPDNRRLSRMQRRRLEFEALRDSMLAACGRLDDRRGGRPVDITSQPFSGRRSVYAFIDRQNLPNVFRTFDFASPDGHAPVRHETTVPQQALFMMNSPFVREMAGALVGSEAFRELGGDDPAARVRFLFRRLLGREPGPMERDAALSYLEDAAAPQTAGPWRFGFGRAPFDDGAVEGFTELACWTGDAWRGGDEFPDPDLGHLTLQAGGGHPGRGDDRSAVRRWNAPADAVVRLEGRIERPSEHGDGVTAVLVSDRRGTLASWNVGPSGIVATDVEGIEVVAGESLDFVVAPGPTDAHDSFQWSVRLVTPDGTVVADSAADFEGRHRLTPWQKLAQVLLCSNEFAFVD